MKPTVLVLSVIAAPLILSGCTTINLGEQLSGDPKTTMHFGLIKLKQDHKGVSANLHKIVVMGGWVGPSGSGLGLKHNTYVKPDPDCQIVFIVKTKEQLNQSIKLVESTNHKNGDKICTTKT